MDVWRVAGIAASALAPALVSLAGPPPAYAVAILLTVLLWSGLLWRSPHPIAEGVIGGTMGGIAAGAAQALFAPAFAAAQGGPVLALDVFERRAFLLSLATVGGFAAGFAAALVVRIARREPAAPGDARKPF